MLKIEKLVALRRKLEAEMNRPVVEQPPPDQVPADFIAGYNAGYENGFKYACESIFKLFFTGDNPVA